MKYFQPLYNYYLERNKILAEAVFSELQLVGGEFFYDPVKHAYNHELRDRLKSNKRTLEGIIKDSPSSLTFRIQDMLAYIWCSLSNAHLSGAAFNIKKR